MVAHNNLKFQIPFNRLDSIYKNNKIEIDRALQVVLESGHYLLGDQLKYFEEEFCQYLNAHGRVVGCNSGTDALVLSMLSQKIGHGDEVIAPSHTAIPTISSIVSVGAIPKFVDVDKETWLIDVHKIEKNITPKTKAIIAVHLYGNMVNVLQIQEILKQLKREDIILIEDVAQASGSTWNQQKAGTLASLGAFSFYPTKNLGAFGDSGAIYCANKNDAETIKQLRFYGQKTRYLAEVEKGVNSRMDEIQASILRVLLQNFDERNREVNKIYQRYIHELSDMPISFQKVNPDCIPAWHLAVIRLKNRDEREKLLHFLENKGIQILIHYPNPVHKQPAFQKYAVNLDLSETEKLCTEILSLPCYLGLSEDEQMKVIESLREFF